MSVWRRADAAILLAHAVVVDQFDVHPRLLAILCGWSTLGALLLFFLMAAEAADAGWFGWLLLPFAALIVAYVQGIRRSGPPRALAADLVSRLIAGATLVVVVACLPWLVAASGMTAPFLMAPLPPALWTATLYFEALPPDRPRRLGRLAPP